MATSFKQNKSCHEDSNDGKGTGAHEKIAKSDVILILKPNIACVYYRYCCFFYGSSEGYGAAHGLATDIVSEKRRICDENLTEYFTCDTYAQNPRIYALHEWIDRQRSPIHHKAPDCQVLATKLIQQKTSNQVTGNYTEIPIKVQITRYLAYLFLSLSEL